MADFLPDNDEILMKYLDGELDQTERAMFESMLQKDTTLQQRLEGLQIAIASVKQYGATEKVKSIHSEMMSELSFVHKEEKVVPIKKMVRYSLAIAASIIIILVGVTLFTAAPSVDKLYSDAFVDYDASTVRGSEGLTSSEIEYQAHNYNDVVAKANTHSLTPKDSLLVGLSYLKEDKLTEAINWFKTISAQNETRQDAEFYLSLAYLKNKNYREALNLMKQIQSNPGHVYNKQFSEDYINKVEKLSSK